MSKALEPVSRAGRVLFELDRFELVDDLYELEGRWSGVRGRRFIRPTLTVMAGGRPIRLLADLAHKPWDPQDGESWTAAFPCRREAGEVLEAELTVAPDITIALAAPGHGVSARPPVPEREAASAPALIQELARAQEDRRALQSQLDRARADRAQTTARLDELLGNLSQGMRDRAQAQAAHTELGTELDALRREHSLVVAERDTAEQERDELAAARDAAVRARDDAVRASEAAVSARDDALAQRGGAITARAQAESAREDALAARAQAETERDAALALRDHALADRDTALTARDHAVADLAAAIAARDDALRERDSLRSRLDQVQLERTEQASSRGAAMVMRRAILEPPAFRRPPSVLPRALAIIVLLATVVAVLIVLRVA